MTGANGRPRLPGSTLLALARLLFAEPLRSSVVEPTISDLQHEMAEAGQSRVRRLRARWRGYGAFARLILVGLFATPVLSETVPAGGGVMTITDLVERLARRAILLTLLVVAGLVLRGWLTVVAVVGAVLAVVIHAWNRQRPSDMPTHDDVSPRAPQINFSSTEVAGNVGGLIFAVGSVFIVAIGVPSLIWFLLGALVAACVLAWGLISWHTNHPTSGLPENRIVLR